LCFLACHDEVLIISFHTRDDFRVKKLALCLTNCGFGLLTFRCLWPGVNPNLNRLTFFFPRCCHFQSVKETTTCMLLRGPTPKLIPPTLLSYSAHILLLFSRDMLCLTYCSSPPTQSATIRALDDKFIISTKSSLKPARLRAQV
jgi:hypothetical protein